MPNFAQNWFRFDTKMIQNFVQKRETVVQENLCCGNPFQNAIFYIICLRFSHKLNKKH